jgi:hypothetical protein
MANGGTFLVRIDHDGWPADFRFGDRAVMDDFLARVRSDFRVTVTDIFEFHEWDNAADAMLALDEHIDEARQS